MVSPADFIAGFTMSKRLALGGRINPAIYLPLLAGALHDGVPPADIYSYIKENVDQFLKEVLSQEPGNSNP